jgi:hypothetical protein
VSPQREKKMMPSDGLQIVEDDEVRQGRWTVIEMGKFSAEKNWKPDDDGRW